MHIVVLDVPNGSDCPSERRAFEAFGSVQWFSRTTLPQLLERARTADVLVTHNFPFRREILDYVTRPRIILAPAERIETLVEIPIARQLGIVVAGFVDENPPCGWIRSAGEALRQATT